MAFTLVATPGAANANSFVTEAEAEDIVAAHTPVAEWEDADSKAALLVMATRVIVNYFSGRRVFYDTDDSYYRVFSTWTGTPATTTQRLPWPRDGMFDFNRNEIANDVIPEDLKIATVELALVLAAGDTTVDIDAAVQGLKSLKVGPVALAFKDNFEGITSKPIPDAVVLAMPPSWFTDEFIEWPSDSLIFEVY